MFEGPFRHVAGRLVVFVSVVALTAIAPGRADAASTLTLMWDPSVDSHVEGYLVYAGEAPGTYNTVHDVGLETWWVFRDARDGQLYCFAVAAYAAGPLVGPRSEDVCGYSNAPPVLLHPGDQASAVGEHTALQLVAEDPDGDPLSYSATGLPPGLVLTARTGYIAGIPTTVGFYTVTATASDGRLSDSQTFTWAVVDGSGTDTVPPVIEITMPTSDSHWSAEEGYVVVGGTASDDTGVALVTWSNNRGWSGHATGTSSWMAGVPLKRGRNLIRVTAWDAAGNSAIATLVVMW